MPRDLFGDVPVYTYDIDAWLRAEPGTARAAHYVTAYNVVGKIKCAKLDHFYEATVHQRHRPEPFWWKRFTWTERQPKT